MGALAWAVAASVALVVGVVVFLACRVAAHMRYYRSLLAVFPTMRPPTLWQMIRHPLRDAWPYR